MAFPRLWFCLSLLLILIKTSSQQKDPLRDFCRRFGHQTTVIDRKLYIDGGLLNWNPIDANPLNYTNDGLLYNDLDVMNDIMPQLYDNLTKNTSIPSVEGGILWADTVNKLFYLYGGDFYQSAPEEFTFWSYDVIYDQWNLSTSDTTGLERASWGAGVAVDDIAKGYYYGGWLSNTSIPGWSGDAMATSNLLIYDMIENTWTNNSGPDTTPRAEGVMVYLPISDGGMLVHFGGISTPYAPENNTIVGENMSSIHLYDISSSKWYTQTATGNVPDQRRRFCAGATWAQDRSSFNIYLYGGEGMPPDITGFDDVYILTIPSFTWIKWYPTIPGTAYPHHSLSCNVIDNSQMLIIGGTFPNSSQCDVPQLYGTHNLNLGKTNAQKAQWYSYMPNLTTYEVPPEIISVVGGGPTGAATLRAPTQGWGDRDLPVYFTRYYTQAVRTPTRYIPPSTPTSNSNGTSHETNVGAIVGGTVGGVAGLFIILGGLAFCFCHRRKRRRREGGGGGGGGQDQKNAPKQPLSELPGSSPLSPGSYHGSHRSPLRDYPPGYQSPQGSVHGTSPLYQNVPPMPLHPQSMSATPQSFYHGQPSAHPSDTSSPVSTSYHGHSPQTMYAAPQPLYPAPLSTGSRAPQELPIIRSPVGTLEQQQMMQYQVQNQGNVNDMYVQAMEQERQRERAMERSMSQGEGNQSPKSEGKPDYPYHTHESS
ncbi:MAG: hypothetical protein M1834_005450 [Cirrosporium novae-zelandiae]|nr:MAG: hypothetical protein M1834_005450 [Cirrosporium novae-zelandiae]